MHKSIVTQLAFIVLVGLVSCCGVHSNAAGQDNQNRSDSTAQSPGQPQQPPITPLNQTPDQASVRSPTSGIDNLGLIALGSIVMAGLTIALGSIAPALGEGRAVAQALSAIAQQPDSSNTITRTLFVGLAMIESTAIYCFVVSMILLFANPFWNYFVQ